MICCIIQARTGSARLPKKVIQKIDNDLTVLDYVIDQVKYSQKIEKIIVATTNLIEDDLICKYANLQKIECFRGSSEDVLDRFYQCAKKYSAKTIVRITADNPLIDPNIIDKIINEYNKCDFITNTLERTFPYGTEVEVFSFVSLEKAWQIAKKPSDREHVTFYLWMQPERFKLFRYDYPINLSKFRFNLDYIQDYCLIRSVFEALYPQNNLFTLEDTIDWLKQNPKILKFNDMIKPNQGWNKSFSEDEKWTK